jgi:uncharacterized protein YkwD
MVPLRPHVVAAAQFLIRGGCVLRRLLSKPPRRFAPRLALVIVACALSFDVASAKAQPFPINESLERNVFVQLNVVRRAYRVAPLRRSAGLVVAARYHSIEMARYGYFGHQSADGSSFERRVARFYPIGTHRLWAVGENLLWATGDIDATEVLRRWLGSPQHRKTMLAARWRDLGIGVVHVATAPGLFGGIDVTLITADFGVRR